MLQRFCNMTNDIYVTDRDPAALPPVAVEHFAIEAVSYALILLANQDDTPVD